MLRDPHPFAVCSWLVEVEVQDPLFDEFLSYLLHGLRSMWSCVMEIACGPLGQGHRVSESLGLNVLNVWLRSICYAMCRSLFLHRKHRLLCNPTS